MRQQLRRRVKRVEAADVLLAGLGSSLGCLRGTASKRSGQNYGPWLHSNRLAACRKMTVCAII